MWRFDQSAFGSAPSSLATMNIPMRPSYACPRHCLPPKRCPGNLLTAGDGKMGKTARHRAYIVTKDQMSYGVSKRRAEAPKVGLQILYAVSKADLFEAAWDLASLCNEAGECDNHPSTAAKLLEMINVRRALRSARPLKIPGIGTAEAAPAAKGDG